MREPMHLSMSSETNVVSAIVADEELDNTLPRGKICEAIRDQSAQDASVSVGPESNQVQVKSFRLRNQNYIACVSFLLPSYTQHNMRYL
jgi:hypothetical protein